MTVKLTITVEHTTPRHLRNPTIWEALADKLGREPTRAEAAADVRRILEEAEDAWLVERATAGKLPHQRRRG